MTPPDRNTPPNGSPGQDGKGQPNFGDTSGSDMPQIPDFPGAIPGYGGQQGGNLPNGQLGGDGMISQNACSIVDYITQRIQNIKTQFG